jgi:hypothetical protein
MKASLFIFIICISTNLFSQENTFKGYVSAGLTVAQIEGDGTSGYKKFGGIGGIGVYFKLHKNWSLGSEINYAMRGSSGMPYDPNGNPVGFFNRTIVTDYVEVPLLFHFHDKEYAMFGLGVCLAGLTRAEYIQDDVHFETTDPKIAQAFKKSDFSGMLNVNFIFNQRFGLNLRGYYSILSLTNTDFAPSMYHNALCVRGIYFFTKKKK